ncbi:MAG TPA: SDR family oxidoreductase [Kofleriaceae bacterium]|jgi:NAD(P)-dependent dehydrogenase (short-subunit alcohol dehydrogenase family)
MRRALVTGSSTGIGRLAVSELLRRGWSVLATMRRADERRDLFAEELAANPGTLEVMSLDVADAGERAAVAAHVMETGVLDCLINNAGYGLFGALEDLSEEQLRRQFEVNFFGAALLTRDLLPALRRCGGSVLLVSSVLGRTGFPLTSGYCASKYALEGLGEALYYELQPLGVRVGIVEPGGRRTRFGDNVEWAAGSTEPYREVTASYRRLLDRVRGRGGKRSGEAVVTALVRLAEAKTVPLRTRVGGDAAAMSLAESLLPERTRTRLFGAMFRRAGVA